MQLRDNIAIVITLMLVVVVAAALVGVGYVFQSDFQRLGFAACNIKHAKKTCECVPRVIARETSVFQFAPVIRNFTTPMEMDQQLERAIKACL